MVIDHVNAKDQFSFLIFFKSNSEIEKHLIFATHIFKMNQVIYNVTVSVDPNVHAEWLNWMREVHIPDVLATGLFLSNRILRVHGHEENGMTYAIQYVLANRAMLDQYFLEHAPRLQAEHVARYGNKATAFRTILEVLDETEC